MVARSILFRPGGRLARELARQAVVLKVNDWVFCHGGLLPHHGKLSALTRFVICIYFDKNEK